MHQRPCWSRPTCVVASFVALESCNLHITSDIVTVYRYCCVKFPLTHCLSTCGDCVSSSDYLYLWITLWITRHGLQTCLHNLTAAETATKPMFQTLSVGRLIAPHPPPNSAKIWTGKNRETDSQNNSRVLSRGKDKGAGGAKPSKQRI